MRIQYWTNIIALARMGPIKETDMTTNPPAAALNDHPVHPVPDQRGANAYLQAMG